MLLLLALWVALSRARSFMGEQLGWDEGLYLCIADRMLDVARLYTDVWDNKPVGIFLN